MLTLLLVAISCKEKVIKTPPKKQAINYKLVKLWETDSILTANESAVYDKVTDAIYVSCMGNSDDIVDGDGFIAKVNLDGTIEKLHWIENLDCPKGLGIYDNKLLIIDINQLITVDLATSKVLSKETITSGNFFNDLDVAPDGTIYLTESHTNDIVKVKDGKSEIYYNISELGSVNGVHVINDKLGFTTSKGDIYAMANDLMPVMIADSCFNPDGLEKYKEGFFCSSWQGKIYYFDKDGDTKKLVDTWIPNEEHIGDIDVVEDKNLLLSPTLFHNRLVAYKIENK